MNKASEIINMLNFDEALKPKDKKVVDAFFNGEALDGKILTTDGKMLSSMGYLGAGELVKWRGDRKGKDGLKILTSGNKVIDDVVRYIKKSFPPNVTKDI